MCRHTNDLHRLHDSGCTEDRPSLDFPGNSRKAENIVRFATILTLTVILMVAAPDLVAGGLPNMSTKMPSKVELTTERSFDPAVRKTARTQPSGVVTRETGSRVQEMALFGLIGLGILGLLWIRRHTSEL